MAIKGGSRQARTAHAASSLSRALGAVLSPAGRRRGFAAASVLAEWRLIVGDALAARCQPVMLEARGGVLHLQASSAAALEIQHVAPQILERVNTYVGFRVARRLRLTQAPLPPPPPLPALPASRALSEAEQGQLEAVVAGIVDAPLRQALLGLGQVLRGRR